MTQIEQVLEQLVIIQNWINSVNVNKKQIHEFAEVITAESTDYLPTSRNQITKKIKSEKLLDLSVFGNWKFIEGSFVEKAVGNLSETILEINDIVYFKKITNGADPLTLIGHTYNGGADKTLRASYTQNQAIDT